MATCVHCGKSKGKRACPALGGEICPACCGKYRLVEIACPADCKWLGGLAALRDSAPIAFTASDEEGATTRLIEFTESGRELATSRAGFCKMLGLTRTPDPDTMRGIHEELGPTSTAAITAHLAFGHLADDGTRAVDRLLVHHGRDLSRGQVAALLAFQRARGLLVDIHAVQAGLGMVLRDRLTGDFITIATEPGEGLGAGTTAYTWIIDNAGKLATVGPLIVIPPEHIAAATARLTAALAAAAEATAEQRRLLLTAAAPLVVAVLRDATPPPAAEPPAAAELPAAT